MRAGGNAEMRCLGEHEDSAVSHTPKPGDMASWIGRHACRDGRDPERALRADA